MDKVHYVTYSMACKCFVQSNEVYLGKNMTWKMCFTTNTLLLGKKHVNM